MLLEKQEVKHCVWPDEIPVKEMELNDSISEWRKLHNPWTGTPVLSQLKSYPVGTILVADYTYRADGDGRMHTGKTVLTKKEEGTWFFEDDCNTFTEQTGNDEFALWAIEVACVYGTGRVKIKYKK